MMRKLLTRLVALACLAAISSCMAPNATDVRQMPIYDVDLATVPDGAYEGSFEHKGFTYEVRTTVAGRRIVKIDVLKNRTSSYARKAEGVIPRVIAKQTPNVDAVTGATKSSKILLKAVENSLTIRTKPAGGPEPSPPGS